MYCCVRDGGVWTASAVCIVVGVTVVFGLLLRLLPFAHPDTLSQGYLFMMQLSGY